MLNQFRFKRDDFREIIIRYHSIMIEKKDIMNTLNEIEQMIKQANEMIYDYQKQITVL